MKLSDILTERRQQKTGIYFHGTSTVFLKSILKTGLLKNPPKRVYQDDGIDDVGQKTFPNAVYLTKDIETASEAQFWAYDSFGGDPMIVVVQYVYNSGEMDEDEFVFHLSTIVNEQRTKSEFVSKMLELFKGMTFNTAIVTKLLENMYDVIDEYMKDNNIKKDQTLQNPNGPFSKLRVYEPYEEIVSELLKRINPKEADTVRVPRDIGFRGKTRIIKIYNPETDEVYYPIQKKE